MARFNPHDPKYQGTRYDVVPEGVYFLAIKAYTRKVSSQKKTPSIDAEVVVLGGENHGACFLHRFWMTDSALWMFASLLTAVGAPDEEIDTQDDATISELILNREFKGQVEVEKNPPYPERSRVTRFYALTQAEVDEVNRILDEMGDPLEGEDDNGEEISADPAVGRVPAGAGDAEPDDGPKLADSDIPF